MVKSHTKPKAPDILAIRKCILTAVAADDVLMEQFVLKGGNALELIWRIGGRSSLDLDFSLAGDLEDLADISRRLERSLHDRFDAIALKLFDFEFGPKPDSRASEPPSREGGYAATFKLCLRERWFELRDDLDTLRRESLETGPEHRRTFRVEISKYEWCAGRASCTVDDYTCYVYTPAMIAAEKLRAIAQQRPSYAKRAHPAPRARDFYDIWAIAQHGVDLVAEREMVRLMFAAKEVPWEFLEFVESEREFHRADWPRVQKAVSASLQPFDFYFGFVAELARRIYNAAG
jgi:hypothetical protein